MYNSVLKIIKIALVHLQESVFRVEVVQYAEKRALRPAWLRDHLWPCSVFCEVIPEEAQRSTIALGQAVFAVVLHTRLGFSGNRLLIGIGAHSPLGPALGEFFRCQSNQYLWVKEGALKMC